MNYEALAQAFRLAADALVADESAPVQAANQPAQEAVGTSQPPGLYAVQPTQAAPTPAQPAIPSPTAPAPTAQDVINLFQQVAPTRPDANDVVKAALTAHGLMKISDASSEQIASIFAQLKGAFGAQ
jgi:hypothetical protein